MSSAQSQSSSVAARYSGWWASKLCRTLCSCAVSVCPAHAGIAKAEQTRAKARHLAANVPSRTPDGAHRRRLNRTVEPSPPLCLSKRRGSTTNRSQQKRLSASLLESSFCHQGRYTCRDLLARPLVSHPLSLRNEFPNHHQLGEPRPVPLSASGSHLRSDNSPRRFAITIKVNPRKARASPTVVFLKRLLVVLAQVFQADNVCPWIFF